VYLDEFIFVEAKLPTTKNTYPAFRSNVVPLGSTT